MFRRRAIAGVFSAACLILGAGCSSDHGQQPALEAASDPQDSPPKKSEAKETAPDKSKPKDAALPKEAAAEPKPLRLRLRKAPELVAELDMDKTRMEHDYEGGPADAVLSPDSKYLAVGGKFGCIRFFSFDGQTAKYLFRRPEPLPRPRIGAHRTLVWIDGDKVAGSGSEHVAFVWDTKNFKLVKAFGSSLNESLQLDWCPSRRLLAMAQKAGIVSVWNYERKFSKNPNKTFDPATIDTSENHVSGVKVLVENMAHYCGNGPGGGRDASTVRVEGVSWSPDGMQIAAVGGWGLDILDASGKGPVLKQEQMPGQYWKKQQAYFKTTEPVRDMPLVKNVPVPASDVSGSRGARGHRVHWASNGKFVAVGYGLSKVDALKKANANVPARIRLFDPSNWKQVREWTPHKVRVYALEFSPDASVLASGGQKEVFLWDPATGEKLMTFPLHGDEVTSTRWSSDGKFLVTTAGSERIDSNGPDGFTWLSNDRKVRIWRVAD